MGPVHHAVRRGLEHASSVAIFKRAQDGWDKVEFPKWGAALMIGTVLLFFIIIFCVSYMLCEVVGTLTMIETPSAAITVSPSDEAAPKSDKEGLVEGGPTITLVHQKPITSSIRGTLRHLDATAGRISRWRGIKLHILYSFCFFVVSFFFTLLIPEFVPGRLILVSALTGGLLANLHATWTHKVISMPNEKSLWQRIVPRSNWKHLAIPAAVEASASGISVFVVKGFSIVLRLESPSGFLSAGLKSFLLIAISLAAILFIVLPAAVTQVRVEASLLPEDQDTIVPFDRSFDGKVTPKILGGTGAVGFIEAWKSFNWEARRRLIKLYIKSFFITLALQTTLILIVVFQAWLFWNDSMTRYMNQHLANGSNSHPQVPN